MAIILCSGFDESLYPKVRLEGSISPSTAIVTLKKSDLPLTLAELAERVSSAEDDELPGGQRYVIISASRSALDGVMKGFRRAYKPTANSVIYAMLTDTAKSWTLEKYLGELAKEHKEMRNYQNNAPVQ